MEGRYVKMLRHGNVCDREMGSTCRIDQEWGVQEALLQNLGGEITREEIEWASKYDCSVG